MQTKLGVSIALHLGAGKINPIEKSNSRIMYSHHIFVDTAYTDGISLDELQRSLTDMENSNDSSFKYLPPKVFVNCDIFEFLEKFRYDVDYISMARFIEHVQRDKLDYFIYVLSTITKKGTVVEVIVPNYETLARMILDEDIFMHEETLYFDPYDIIVTTELLNEQPSPHLSIWTPFRAKYYFEKEGRFKVDGIIDKFEFDGRDVYMYFNATRV